MSAALPPMSSTVICPSASTPLSPSESSFGMGLKRAPRNTQSSTMAPVITKAFSQPWRSMSSWTSGAMRKVPRPEPQTAIPVAKARFFSKYIETLTMAGR